MLLNISFNLGHGPRRGTACVWVGVGGVRECAPVMSLRYWSDVSDVSRDTFFDWPVKKSPHSHQSQMEQVLTCNTLHSYQYPKIFR